jgi:inorganic pyrophosphatase
VNPGFRGTLDEPVDRPKGSGQPRFSVNTSVLYDGFLEGATSGDGQGTGVWLVSGDPHQMAAVLCAADQDSRATELKLLPSCTTVKAQLIARFTKTHAAVRSLLVPTP